MPKIREINKMPPEEEGNEEQQIAALRDYLVKITQELYFLLTYLDKEAAEKVVAHMADMTNPHQVTKAQLGLGNVENERQYSAAHPPAPADIGAVATNDVGVADGVASLDSGGKIPSTQLPSYLVDGVLWFPSVTVSAGQNQQIIAISSTAITADHVLAEIEFDNPEYVTSGYNWITAEWGFALTGTATAATTANVLLVRKGN